MGEGHDQPQVRLGDLPFRQSLRGCVGKGDPLHGVRGSIAAEIDGPPGARLLAGPAQIGQGKRPTLQLKTAGHRDQLPVPEQVPQGLKRRLIFPLSRGQLLQRRAPLGRHLSGIREITLRDARRVFLQRLGHPFFAHRQVGGEELPGVSVLNGVPKRLREAGTQSRLRGGRQAADAVQSQAPGDAHHAQVQQVRFLPVKHDDNHQQQRRRHQRHHHFGAEYIRHRNGRHRQIQQDLILPRPQGDALRPEGRGADLQLLRQLRLMDELPQFFCGNMEQRTEIHAPERETQTVPLLLHLPPQLQGKGQEAQLDPQADPGFLRIQTEAQLLQLRPSAEEGRDLLHQLLRRGVFPKQGIEVRLVQPYRQSLLRGESGEVIGLPVPVGQSFPVIIPEVRKAEIEPGQGQDQKDQQDENKSEKGMSPTFASGHDLYLKRETERTAPDDAVRRTGWK